jgi:hypothetical protein
VEENMKDKELITPTQLKEDKILLPNKTYSIQEYSQPNSESPMAFKQLNRLKTHEIPLNKKRCFGLGDNGKNPKVQNNHKKSDIDVIRIDADGIDNEEDLDMDGIAEFTYEQELADKLGALQQNIPRVIFMERLASPGLES